MAYNNADFAVKLPNAFPSPGEVLQQGIALNERKQERNDALLERQREFNQRQQAAQQDQQKDNEKYNLKQIQEGLNPKVFETPNHIIDNALTTGLKSVYDEAMQHVKGDPLIVSQIIKNGTDKLGQWVNLAKQHSQEINSQVTNLSKQIPIADLNLLNQGTTKQFKDVFFDKDKDGNYTTLKEPSLIPQQINYVEQYDDPNNLANIITTQKPLYDFFRNIPKYAIKGNEYTSNKGKVIQKGYQGFTTPYSDKVTGDDNKIEIKPKSELVYTNPNSEPIRVADPELRKAMESDKSVEAAFNQSWNNELKAKNLQNENPHVLDILKEAYRYKFAEEQMKAMHEVNFSDKQITPVVKNYIGTGSKEVTFNDVAKILDKWLPKEGIAPLTAAPSEAREYFSTSVNKGRNSDNYLDVSKLGIVKANDGTYRIIDMDDNSDNKGDVVGTYSTTGVNLKTNTGGQAVKTAILKKESSPQTKFSREIEDGIAAVMEQNKGVTRQQVIDALRKAGKIK